jgi:hypothetical protein
MAGPSWSPRRAPARLTLQAPPMGYGPPAGGCLYARPLVGGATPARLRQVTPAARGPVRGGYTDERPLRRTLRPGFPRTPLKG